MLDPTLPIQTNQELPAMGDISCNLEADVIAKLEVLAEAWGVCTHEALAQLLVKISHPPRQQATPELQMLTNKQVAVLKCLKMGLSVKEIAGQLGVSENTIRTHIRRIRCQYDSADLLSLRYL